MPGSSLLERDLRSAVSAGGLTIAYQAQYELDDVPSRIGAAYPAPVAVEALCRWNHPTLGPVPPDHFIPIAQRADLLADVDRHILVHAANQIARWRDAGSDVALSVNASPEHFSTGYADTVIACLDELRLDPGSITIEIIEAPVPQLRPEMRATIEMLQAIGVMISVDDFDAGNTTVPMLESLPIDEVKIDRGLTQRADAAADAAVAAVAQLGAKRGWRLVAEGIETPADLERARRRGCHRGQGYLWGRPMSPEEIGQLVLGG
jgi:EAL domain-containing protein (putative c-di-GMP-specific phosphodiesterase class I)